MKVSMQQIEKFLPWLFPLFAFLLPLQTRWIARNTIVGDSVWEYGRVSVYGFDIVLIVINLFILFVILAPYRGTGQVKAGIQKEQKKENDFRLFSFSGSQASRCGMTMRCLVLAAWAGAFIAYQLFISLDPVLTAVVLGRMVLIVLAGWYLMRLDPMVMRRTCAAFVVAMVLSAGFGTAQFFAQDSIVSGKWLGISWQEASVPGTSVVEAAGGRWLRAHGTMPHPNALGGFSAIALVLFFSPLVARSSHNSLPFTLILRQVQDRLLRGRVVAFARNVFIACAPLVLLAGIVTTASRAAIIALVASGIVFVLEARSDVRYRILLPWIKGMAIAGLLIVLLAGPVAFTRFTAHGRLEALSFTKRAAALNEVVVTMREHGVAGTGLGGATVALKALYPQLPIWELQPVHNMPLLLVVELGAGGIGILGAAWYFIVRNSKFKIQNSKPKVFAPLMICFFILAMLDHYLWTLPAGLYVSGLLALAWRRGLDKELPSD